MKKYFIHNGSEEQGPFTIDELRDKRITKDTMIWYEGIDKWTKAGELSELRDAISIVPPPYKPQSSPPPYPETQKVTSEKVKKGKSVWKTIIGIIVVVLIVVGGLVLLNVFNNPRSNTFMQIKVNPPSPRVVENHAAEDPSSDVFDFKEAVYATVLNQGGEGKVLITAHLEQGGNNFERSEQVYMRNNETHEFHFVFSEVKALSGRMNYNVEAKSIE